MKHFHTIAYLLMLYLLLLSSCDLEKIEAVNTSCSNPPQAAFTTDKTTGAAPLTVNFTNNSTQAQSYIWDFGDNSASVTTANASHLFQAAGNFTVRLIAQSADGCRDTLTQSIAVVSKNTFVKNIDIGDSYNSGSAQNPYLAAMASFVGDQFRFVQIFPNPGKIKVYRWDSLGNEPNGYPLSAFKSELNDSFAFSYVFKDAAVFIRTRPRCLSPSISDSCNSWSVRLCSNNTGSLIRVNELDNVKFSYPDMQQFSGLSAYDGINLSLLDNGRVAVVEHLSSSYWDPVQGKTIYDKTDVLISQYDDDLQLKDIRRLDFHREDLSWALWETSNKYILQGMAKPSVDPCINWGGSENRYLDKSSFSLQQLVPYDNFIGVDFGSKAINDGSKALLTNDGDPSISNRLKIQLYGNDGETVQNGFPLFVSPPAGYSNIIWGDVLKKGNVFYVACLIKVNPNSISNDLCLLKISNTGQILDTDIYDAAKGIPAGLKQNVAFRQMADGGFLIQSYSPDSGKLTLMRVDKNGDL